MAEAGATAQETRQQASVTINRETTEVPLEIECQFATAANDRRIASEEERRKSLVTAVVRGA